MCFRIVFRLTCICICMPSDIQWQKVRGDILKQYGWPNYAREQCLLNNLAGYVLFCPFLLFTWIHWLLWFPWLPQLSCSVAGRDCVEPCLPCARVKVKNEQSMQVMTEVHICKSVPMPAGRPWSAPRGLPCVLRSEPSALRAASILRLGLQLQP